MLDGEGGWAGRSDQGSGGAAGGEGREGEDLGGRHGEEQDQ